MAGGLKKRGFIVARLKQIKNQAYAGEPKIAFSASESAFDSQKFPIFANSARENSQFSRTILK
jgi:hypothetical protein